MSEKYNWKLNHNNAEFKGNCNIIHHIGELKNPHSVFSTCKLEKIVKANKICNLNKFLNYSTHDPIKIISNKLL